MIDWTKPLELMDGTPVRLQTSEEMGRLYGGTNPDNQGDYWIIADGGDLRGICSCQYPDTDEVRNRLGSPPTTGSAVEKEPTETLRDRFAMAALGSVFRHTTAQEWSEAFDQDNFIAEATAAYAIADAMMAARQ